MPTYDYKCSKCDSVFELSKKISDRDDVSLQNCPECSQTGFIQRLVGSPMVAYSVTVKGGYGNNLPDGFKQVLSQIDSKAPGSRLRETSTYNF